MSERRLTREERAAFDTDGFVLVEGLLDYDADIAPVLEEYSQVLDELARELFEAGEIASPYEELPFGERMTQIIRETGRVFAQHFDCSLPQGGTRADSPIWVGPAVFHTLRHEKILNIVEDLIGPEVYSNPVQHIRIKPPQAAMPDSMLNASTGYKGGFAEGVTPWHQDNGVVLPNADASEMLTVWFPLTQARVENGCLEVIRGSHRTEVLQHCRSGAGLGIPDAYLDLDSKVTVPMQPGDVLFMHRRTCHSSLPNVSHDVRISFDIRYNPTGQPTGREQFPGFVARSRRDPAKELRDPVAWAESWYETRARLSGGEIPAFNRWRIGDPGC